MAAVVLAVQQILIAPSVVLAATAPGMSDILCKRLL